MQRWIVLALLLIITGACKEKTPDEESRTYNVFLFNDKNQLIPSGTVTGLSACRYIANKRIRGSKNPGWDYYCCWEYQENACYQKDH
jgi:hypothetical protein